MAYAPSRSAIGDLHAGMTDGAYKKFAPNRGGVLDTITAEYRLMMSGAWHGFRDHPVKMLPDGRVSHPPYHENVDPEDIENI